MQLKSKEEFRRERIRLSALSKKELESMLKELYHKRYVEQDIEYESRYRLVSSVYLQKTSPKTSLVFHMKNFVG